MFRKLRRDYIVILNTYLSIYVTTYLLLWLKEKDI